MAYLLFVYTDFTAGGGWHDYRGQFSTCDDARTEAVDLLQGGGATVAQVVDAENAVMVLELAAFRDRQGFGIREETLERIVN